MDRLFFDNDLRSLTGGGGLSRSALDLNRDDLCHWLGSLRSATLGYFIMLVFSDVLSQFLFQMFRF